MERVYRIIVLLLLYYYILSYAFSLYEYDQFVFCVIPIKLVLYRDRLYTKFFQLLTVGG